jgi:CHASE2 domain-containing sensor protein
LVQIDDDAFEKLGERQPLPRSYIASLIDIVARGGAKAIGLDIELKVATDRVEDDRLLGAIASAAENGNSKVVSVFYVRPLKEDDRGMLFRRSEFFDSRFAGIAGFATAPVDSDGFIRQVPLTLRGSDGKVLPSLALAVAARAAGYDAASLDKALNDGVEIKLSLPEWSRLDGKRGRPLHHCRLGSTNPGASISPADRAASPLSRAVRWRSFRPPMFPWPPIIRFAARSY